MIKQFRSWSGNFLHNMNRYGWQTWYFQNLLMLFSFLLLFPNFVLLILILKIGSFLGAIINLIFFFVLILDLLAVAQICLYELYLLWQDRTIVALNWRFFLSPLFGGFWIVSSLLWRFQLFIQGPYNLGLGFQNLGLSSLNILIRFNLDLNFNFIVSIFLFLGNVFLVLFLISQESYSLTHSHKQSRKGSFFGIMCLIGTIMVVVSGYSFHFLNLYSFGLLIKLLITPIVGIIVTRHFFVQASEVDLLDESEKDIYIKAEKPSPSQSHSSIKPPIPIRPSRSALSKILAIILLLMVIPFTPFFILNAYPFTQANGPYINRIATTSEENVVLEHIESLDLKQLTGYTESYYPGNVMNNATLEIFLDNLDAIDRDIINSPFSYYFNWTVAVYESDFPLLNTTSFVKSYPNWPKWQSNNLEFTYLTWWDNDGLQHTIEQENYWEPVSLNETDFSNNLEIKWIYAGYLDSSYDYLFPRNERIKQLIFLNAELNVVCFAIADYSSLPFSF